MPEDIAEDEINQDLARGKESNDEERRIQGGLQTHPRLTNQRHCGVETDQEEPNHPMSPVSVIRTRPTKLPRSCGMREMHRTTIDHRMHQAQRRTSEVCSVPGSVFGKLQRMPQVAAREEGGSSGPAAQDCSIQTSAATRLTKAVGCKGLGPPRGKCLRADGDRHPAAIHQHDEAIDKHIQCYASPAPLSISMEASGRDHDTHARTARQLATKLPAHQSAPEGTAPPTKYYVAKTFDKVWHQGLHLKMHRAAISKAMDRHVHTTPGSPRGILDHGHSSWPARTDSRELSLLITTQKWNPHTSSKMEIHSSRTLVE
ncbi:hypothetical protein Trydic_g17623 [Trypoxylus dichotomus]